MTCVGALTLANFMTCQFITRFKVKDVNKIESVGSAKGETKALEKTTMKSAESREELRHHVVDIEGKQRNELDMSEQ